MLKIHQIFPKLYRCFLYVVFHNLEPKNAGLGDLKKDLNLKRSKGIFVRENLTFLDFRAQKSPLIFLKML